MGPFDRRAAIVTGAASGIGAATLRRLRRDGADVIGTDIDEAAGQRVAQEAGARFFAQDTSDPAGWDELMQLSQREFGRLDILVNNAGMTTGQSIDDVDLKTWERVIGVNLTGVMLGCRAAVRLMRDNPGGAPGAIVNVASTSAYAALPTDIGYTAAKSGVRMLTKSVAVHCAKQGYPIRCNNIVPGATDTGILSAAEEVIPGLKAAVAATSPLNRLGRPEEIAAAIAFLASDECPFMTGAELSVDGAVLAGHPGF